jgi:hypothetical protein
VTTPKKKRTRTAKKWRRFLKIELKPDTLLIEPKAREEGVLWQPNGRETSVGIVRQSAYADVIPGVEVLYYPSAGLGIKSNGRKFLLLGAADILAVVEVS